MSTRSNKGIWLLLVEPLDLERMIHKSKRAVDTLQAAIGSVEIQASIDTIHPASVDENEMLRDEEGRTLNNAGQLINAQGDVKTPSRVFLTKIPETTSKSWRISCQGVSRMKCLNTTCSAISSPILSLGMHSAGSVNYNQDL
ncbi:hypothetical protein F2Q68_00045016 [Brassica cretica]|uniref:Uncharacterized protein n=1 Tax=Brassica cretica TaxID=69181 RepID=A0A8S9LUE8_BRACR|nr:hypothetical protein F2Q68_00045016 [Brassica cretica]